MRVEAFIVNAFTDRLGCGNPAAVVLLDRELPAEAMQTIAFDMNKSETAFVARGEADGAHAIRWFTPVKEVPLCGHATLAASKALHEMAPFETVTFRYAGGLLPIARAEGGAFEMDFPLDDYDVVEAEPAYRSFFPGVGIRECIHGRRTGKVVVRLDDAADLEGLRPDFAAMKGYRGLCSSGIGLTRRSSRYDCESRYFNPWYGVDEDPVTGSVHTLLARYWGRILGTERLRAYQASHRPGELWLRIAGERVKMAGKARIVMRGAMDL